MKRISAFLLVATASVVAPACDPGVDGPGDNNTDPDDPTNPADEWNKKLDARKPDYNAALRIASLRLIGELPTMTQINLVANAADDAGKKAAYEGLVDSFLADPRFSRQMMVYFRDLFRMGGTVNTVDLETAPAFAASLAVANDSYMKLLTATTGTCPTFSAATNTFTAANCANNVTTHAGVLTNPGMNAHFTSNFAFRRVDWVQRTFNCQKFPADLSETPETYGGKLYTGKFPWLSVAGKTNGGRVDFHDVQSVVCMGCHNVMNHIAPLFANFNETGQMTAAIAVKTPLGANDLARATDFLPAGEPFAYRLGQATPDLPSLGTAMAADPEVARCAVKRFVNWAQGKEEITTALTLVPDTVIQTQTEAFVASGFKIKDLIRGVFTSDDFVKF